MIQFSPLKHLYIWFIYCVCVCMYYFFLLVLVCGEYSRIVRQRNSTYRQTYHLRYLSPSSSKYHSFNFFLVVVLVVRRLHNRCVRRQFLLSVIIYTFRIPVWVWYRVEYSMVWYSRQAAIGPK